MRRRIEIDQGWEFKQTTALGDGAAKDFLPVSQFPTVSYLDLLHYKLIPDPYLDQNELKTLWVNHADWTYRTSQLGPLTIKPHEKAVLVFEGLDTAVEVFLDGKHILSSKNMHVWHRVDITSFFEQGKLPQSTLELRFTSATTFSKKERERIGYKHDENMKFGNDERLFLRKAQYHWGWDWGPTVQPCGPWKPIYVETFQTRIAREKILVTRDIGPHLKVADISVKGFVDHPANDIDLTAELLDPSGAALIHSEARIIYNPDGSFEIYFMVLNPQIWYPFQYGEQPLYLVRIKLGEDDVFEQTVGLRRVRLLQHPLKNAKGTSFVFEINNIRIFCGGSCWIPGDFLLPRMTTERYEAWISTLKRGNQSMVRVWGGGIVENDCFYDICDREGILVWQDFLFACGNYPASPDFVENIRNEAEQHVIRVGHHPSLVIWAGNNEDYQLANIGGWTWDSKDKGPWDNTNFPARLIYEHVLPDVIKRLGRGVPYVRSSPYGGEENANDPTIGDVHIWDIWHGPMAPYQNYKDFMGQFVSEFGFESAPSLHTITKAITDPRERFSQSRTWMSHDKAPGHTRRYGMYMSENFRFVMQPIDAYIYCTQFLQAEAMSYAYNLWRREFRGPGEENCGGALVWQTNDIWPGMSWAIVDVNLKPKAAWYVVKRALQKVTVGVERVVTKSPPEEVVNYEPEKRACEIWAVNSNIREVKATLKLVAFDIETGNPVTLPHSEAERELVLAPNRSTDVCRVEIPQAESSVLVAYLDDTETGTILARWVSWPEPYKYLRFRSDLKVDVRVQDDQVFLSTNAPVKGVMLDAAMEDGEDAMWADNFIDLVPGEMVAVEVKALNGKRITTRWLCDWEGK
ncbi:glycoside hydrolase family 2 protein [Xylogone sp. PMI_703]|nr:glycoside hydrolase family 2 protein [Xylogone sp. PMI_703]